MLESVILKTGEKESLLSDIRKFRSSRERYRRLGLPYHRGYLLYGPPGTGKTSLISALAAELSMSIYAVNLSEFNDRTLVRAINDVPPNSIILFEDIDCMKSGDARKMPTTPPSGQSASSTNVETTPQLGVTLSGLLNVLDGFHAPEDVLFTMTSNAIETLDVALLRPGRIDYRLYMGTADVGQKLELYRRFFPGAPVADAEAFVESNSASTMAEFQGLLLQLEQECQELEQLVARA
jgi:chaperone BCS1